MPGKKGKLFSRYSRFLSLQQKSSSARVFRVKRRVIKKICWEKTNSFDEGKSYWKRKKDRAKERRGWRKRKEEKETRVEHLFPPKYPTPSNMLSSLKFLPCPCLLFVQLNWETTHRFMFQQPTSFRARWFVVEDCNTCCFTAWQGKCGYKTFEKNDQKNKKDKRTYSQASLQHTYTCMHIHAHACARPCTHAHMQPSPKLFSPTL